MTDYTPSRCLLERSVMHRHNGHGFKDGKQCPYCEVEALCAVLRELISAVESGHGDLIDVQLQHCQYVLKKVMPND